MNSISLSCRCFTSLFLLLKMSKFGKTDLVALSDTTIMPICELLVNGYYRNDFCLHYSQHQTHTKYCTNEWKMDDYKLMSQTLLSK